DGCIQDKSHKSLRLSIMLGAVKDGENHLKKFKSDIKAENNITHVKKERKILNKKNNKEYIYVQDAYAITITSNKLCNDLIKYGVTPRKSLTLRHYDVRLDLQRHYYRGLIDGDGHISVYKKWKYFDIYNYGFAIGLSGAYDIVSSFQQFLVNNLGNKYKDMKISKNGSIYRIQYTGGEHKGEIVLPIIKLLYDDSNVYLTPNRTVIDRCVNVYTSSRDTTHYRYMQSIRS
ncbi:MAG: hypothetical protein ACYDG3_11130, partial [Bacillati bacterium]